MRKPRKTPKGKASTQEAAWTPLVPARAKPGDLGRIAAILGIPEDRLDPGTLYVNSRYQVAVRRQQATRYGGPDLVHLSVKRRDGAPVHDWRDLQRIKNELLSPEHEAVELYPAESRKVDAANQFHLWALDDPTFRWPVGFDERLVSEEPKAGAKQRPFESS